MHSKLGKPIILNEQGLNIDDQFIGVGNDEK